MFDKAEAEYRELSEKKRIVENDKDKIRKVRYSLYDTQATACATMLIMQGRRPVLCALE